MHLEGVREASLDLVRDGVLPDVGIAIAVVDDVVDVQSFGVVLHRKSVAEDWELCIRAHWPLESDVRRSGLGHHFREGSWWGRSAGQSDDEVFAVFAVSKLVVGPSPDAVDLSSRQPIVSNAQSMR